MPPPQSSREAVLERTFRIYLRHLPYWLGLLLFVIATASAVFLLLDRGMRAATPVHASPAVARALAVVPALAAGAWVLAGMIGGQVLALSAATGTPERLPSAGVLLRRLASRFGGTLATAILVIVHVAALGLVGAGAAAALAWVPLGVLPRFGVSHETSRSLTLLVLLPLLVAGVVPALWWLGRHAIAIPLQTLEGRSPWASLRRARALTRGHVVSVLGLVIVTTLASQAVVLLSRAGGSLLTLLVFPDRFRPIFGEGPLRSAAGADVQLGATVLATVVTLPLMLLPFSLLCLALRDGSETDRTGAETDRT